MYLPDKIKQAIGNEAYDTDNIGMSGASVLMFPGAVLKIQNCCEEAENEYKMLVWLRGKLPVPEVLAYEEEKGKSYLLMSRCEGTMSCDEAYMRNPKELVKLLAEGLKALWQTDTKGCPGDWSLKRKLAAAKENVETGLVDVDDCEPETFGKGGFRNPEELWQWLYDNRSEEEPVMSHGDYCLPNVFGNQGKLSGFIDLGRAGIADKWCDIALCYRSLKHNFAGTYDGRDYPGYEEGMLFRELGIEPDWEKIRYFMLLDELF